MLKNKLLFIALCISIFSYAQEINYKIYSYTELFDMIENEKDSVFELKNAWVKYDSVLDKKNHGLYTDDILYTKGLQLFRKDSIYITKELKFENVLFNNDVIKYDINKRGAFYFINFTNRVSFKNCLGTLIHNTFKESISITFNDNLSDLYNQTVNRIQTGFFNLSNNKFEKNFLFNGYSKNESKELPVQLIISTNNFVNNLGYSRLNLGKISSANILNNKVKCSIDFNISGRLSSLELLNNDFNNSKVGINLGGKSAMDYLLFAKNNFNKIVFLSINNLNQENIIDWSQFKKGVLNSNNYISFLDEIYFENNFSVEEMRKNDDNQTFLNEYLKVYQYENKLGNKRQIKFLGSFYDHYKRQHDTESANAVYVEIKNLETKRLAFIHNQNPTFKSFFTWRINQFLEIFSGYGTEPARAVIFSMYVILCFAFIYLLFPNSWDTLGNRRLMSRFEFFQKYLRRKEGMHTIYLEGKKEEISSYEDFKTTLENSKTELPSFFISWAKPLYNASMFSSRVTSRFLQNTDILKGKWQDLSPKQKRWKNIQIGFLLTLGLVYDLFIKALNALMLSINTFTTLGFGEIPIKGLPRYLAIIQGFIGWFMLTIFSVSLISQLLN